MQTSPLKLIAIVGLIAFMLPDRQAGAQQPAQASAESSASAPGGEARRAPEVIIKGDSAEFATRITTFVNQITDFNMADPGHGMARWEGPACPMVSGLPRDEGEFILWRISDLARQAGTPLGGESCHPNIFIVVRKHPQAYLEDLTRRHSSDVFDGATPTVISGFIESNRPVRSWYSTAQQTPEGLPMLVESFPGISQQHVAWVPGGVIITPVRPAIGDSALTNPWSQASHLVLNAVWAIKKVLVVVDSSQTKGVSIGQLADYVSMAALAQIRLDSHPTTDQTILTLFDASPAAASAGVTDWDQAFLKAVYASEQKSVMQRNQIAHEMVHQIGHY
jgi:hypothetical protein